MNEGSCMKKYNAYHQRGSIFFPLVLFVSLWIVTMTVYLFYYMHWQSKEQDAVAYKQLNQKLVREVDIPLSEYIQAVEGLVGFTEQDFNRVSLEKLIKNINTLTNGEGAGSAKSYEIFGISSPEIFEEKLASTSYPVNIEVALRAFEARVIELQEQEKILKEGIYELEKDIDSKKTEYNNIKDKLSAHLDELSREKGNLEEKYTTFIDKVIGQKEVALESKEKFKEERRKSEDQLRVKRVDYENLVSKKIGDIKLLQAEKYGGQEKRISEPKLFDAAKEFVDGEVVFGDALSNTIYINLGRKNKIFRGLKFDVFRLVDKGEKEFKGRIEVKRVMDKISETMIIEQVNQTDPIVSGDVIINPIFSENRPIYATFTEDNLTKPRIEKLIQDIREVGGVVENKVTSRTNLVIIDNENKGIEHENYEDAVKFQIPLVDEKTLMKYIGDQ